MLHQDYHLRFEVLMRQFAVHNRPYVDVPYDDADTAEAVMSKTQSLQCEVPKHVRISSVGRRMAAFVPEAEWQTVYQTTVTGRVGTVPIQPPYCLPHYIPHILTAQAIYF